MAEGEDVVRVAGSVGVVLLDLKIGLMIEQTIQNMRGVTHRGTDRPRMERRVTIRDVSVEHHYRIGSAERSPVEFPPCALPEAGAGAPSRRPSSTPDREVASVRSDKSRNPVKVRLAPGVSLYAQPIRMARSRRHRIYDNGGGPGPRRHPGSAR